MGAGQRSSPFSSIFPPTILPQVDDYIKEGYADEMETRVRGTALILQASATAAAAETAIDLLSRIASYAVVAPAQRNKRPLKRPGANGPKRVPGGPRLKPCSCGQGKPHKNSNYKGCANYKGKGQVEGAPGGAPGGGSSSSSSWNMRQLWRSPLPVGSGTGRIPSWVTGTSWWRRSLRSPT